MTALQPSRLRALGHHHDGAAVVLPDQAPEVVLGRRQRTLGGDELALRAETLHRTVQHVRASLTPRHSDINS